MPRSRRQFVRDLTLGGVSLAALGLLSPAAAARLLPGTRPVRVRGRVTDARTGRGIAAVAVTDGLAVVATGRDGAYELVTDAARGYVSLTVPAGYELPTRAGGLARCYAPLAPGAGGEASASFALRALAAPDARHRFLLLADPQTQNAFEMGRLHAETVPDVAATLRGGDVPAFGVACGDIMYDDLALYPEYERAVAAMGVPFVQVVGNHDLDLRARTHFGSTATFRRRYGPTYWSFERGAVHYVVLHDVFWHGAGYLGYLDDAQLAWLAADLARVERGRTVVVLLHIPAHSTRAEREGARSPTVGESVANRDALYELLAPYRSHVLSGHTHEHEHLVTGTRHEHVHGAVCGAWWSGDLCWDGTPNGYAVYDVAGEEVRWRYKATGQDASAQMRVHAPGADPAAPGAVVANVWDWDPAWTVTWYEDGARKGAMQRRPGTDPLAVAQQAGADRPARRAWVEPTVTGHLFRATPAPAAREVRVEATDRWGRTYTALAPMRPA